MRGNENDRNWRDTTGGNNVRWCYGCGEPGHFAKFCPHKAKGKGCAVCGSLAHRTDMCAQRITTDSRLMAVKLGHWVQDKRGEEKDEISMLQRVQARFGGHVRQVYDEVVATVKPVDCPFQSKHLVYPIKVNGVAVKAMIDSGASHSFVSQQLVERHGMEPSKLIRPLNVGLFADPAIRLTQVLKDCEVEVAGRSELWELLIMPECPEEVVLGLDAIWEWCLFVNPRDDTLCRLTKPGDLEIASPPESTSDHVTNTKLEDCEENWDVTDLVWCDGEEGEEALMLEKRGLVLRSVTASSDTEEKLLKEFREKADPELLAVVDQHPQLFAPPDCEPPDRSVKHYIWISPDAQPVRAAPYRLAGSKLEAMREQITDLADKGWIQPSSSPWASPILFVEKDGGSKLRMCTDLRNLNALTKKDAFPLPRLDLALHRAAKAKIFSKIDLASGFHQIEVYPPHRELTAFVLPEAVKGSAFWEWRVMPFGLVNAPATFQRAMSLALKGCEDCSIVYIDDVLVFSLDREQHLLHLKRVFDALQQQGYHVRLEKCTFLQDSVKFLGHVISPEGIHAAADRNQVMSGFKTPFMKAKQVRSFLGLVMWYKSFIPHAATLAAPLFDLTSTKKKFEWTPQLEQAVEALKKAVTQAPVLVRYDALKETRVTTDASSVGIGAVLEQKHEEGWKPVAFWSRKLKDPETRYSATDLEWLAVVEAVSKVWYHFLEDLSFIVRSDHQALARKLHKSSQDPPFSARQARWIEKLMPFALTFEYVKGKENVIADVLSRHPEDDASGNKDKPAAEMKTITVISAQLAGILQRMALAAAEDEDYQERIQEARGWGDAATEREENGLLKRHDGCIVVPRDDVLRTLLLAEAHDSRLGGHFGEAKTLEKLRRIWSWRGMARDVSEYVRSCSRCQVVKTDTGRRKGLLMPIMAPEPWHTITMDFVGGFQPAKVTGRTHCLVIVDKFSKYVMLEPVSEKVTAVETAEVLLRRVIAPFGTPVKVISDRGPQFTAAVWQEVLKIMGTSVALAATHHPQSDGQTERSIQTLIQLLRCYSEERQDEWEQLLPLFQYALNDAYCEATGTTPFRVVLGRDPCSPFRFLTGEEIREVPLGPLEMEAELSRRLMTVNDFVRRKQEAVAQRMQDRYNRTRVQLEFRAGDLVLLSTRSHPKLAGKRKQGRIRVGPYVVKGKRNVNAYVLEGLPPGIPSVQNVSFLFPYHTSPIRFTSRPVTAAAEPVNVDGEIEWEVEEVSDFRQQKNGLRRYLVKWAGSPQRQWLPEEEMQHCTLAIRRYFGKLGQSLPTGVNEFCLWAERDQYSEKDDPDAGLVPLSQPKEPELNQPLPKQGGVLTSGAELGSWGEARGGDLLTGDEEQPSSAGAPPFNWKED